MKDLGNQLDLGINYGKVASGKRPKEKKVNTQLLSHQRPGTAASAARLSVIRPSQVTNPLNRLCELLLPWTSVAREFSNYTRGGGEKTEESVEIYSNLRPLPNVFDTYDEYLTAWEPLVVEEIKSSVLNSMSARINAKGNQSHKFNCNIAEISPQNGSCTHLVALDCNFDVQFESSNRQQSWYVHYLRSTDQPNPSLLNDRDHD